MRGFSRDMWSIGVTGTNYVISDIKVIYWMGRFSDVVRGL